MGLSLGFGDVTLDCFACGGFELRLGLGLGDLFRVWMWFHCG